MRMVLLNTEMFFLVKLTVLLPGVTQNWGWFDRSTKPHLRYAKFWCRFSIMRSYFVRTFRKFFLNHKLVRSSSLFCRYMRLINCLDGYFDWEWHTVVVLLSMLFSSDLWNKQTNKSLPSLKTEPHMRPTGSLFHCVSLSNNRCRVSISIRSVHSSGQNRSISYAMAMRSLVGTFA